MNAPTEFGEYYNIGTLNFRAWLEAHGVDSDIFWENCKTKHFCGYTRKVGGRKKLGQASPDTWLSNAFVFDMTLLPLTAQQLGILAALWEGEVLLAHSTGMYIDIGFPQKCSTNYD